MRNARREQINELADCIRRVLELGVPVDIEAAVRRLNGSIKTVSNPAFEAKIEKVADEAFTISLSTVASDRRRRFSIAHELGHLFLHMGYLLDSEKWSQVGEYTDSVYFRSGYNTEEYEANEFAGAFLMPRDEFIAIANRNRDGSTYFIEPIASHFDVSTEAAVTRGRWLSLFSWG